MAENSKRTLDIVVTGATGYVGGRLVRRLLDDGYRVRAVGRSLAKLQARLWSNHSRVELCESNLLDAVATQNIFKGADVVFFLVHSMNPEQKDFSKADRLIAQNAAYAAQETGVKRIVYLGGLGEVQDNLSEHLSSRAQVAEVLKESSVPVTVFRAAMIIGSGSVSFEMLRYLVDRLPVMVTPKWLNTPNEPIAIRNVIEYLARCLEVKETVGETFDIGCGEVTSYRGLMDLYAKEAGLKKRWIFPLPFLSLNLSAVWIHVVTPIPASLAKPLVEGLRNPVICKDKRIRDLIPQELVSPQEAIRYALGRYHEPSLETHWSDAGELPPVEWLRKGDPHWAGGTMFRDERSMKTKATPEALWAVVSRIGGQNGWYHATWLWKLRGLLDRLFGGSGYRMGRRDQNQVVVGDALDFWRVCSVKPNYNLCLVAEMKLPGRAVLEFRIVKDDAGAVFLEQIAAFRPRGLAGILYWYSVAPFHAYIFGGMIRKIVRLSE